MEVAGANAYWPSPFRCRDQRRGYGVAQLFSLGSTTLQMTDSPSVSVTLRKELGGVVSTVTIDLSVSGSEFGIYIRDGEIARELRPSPECAAIYSDAEQLYRACLAGASEGVICTSRAFCESCGRVRFTRLLGTWLPAGCATAFEIAASIALLRALSRPEQLTRSMDGWSIVI